MCHPEAGRHLEVEREKMEVKKIAVCKTQVTRQRYVVRTFLHMFERRFYHVFFGT
jgi:hypothetical protein